jgi:hypothetical protein
MSFLEWLKSTPLYEILCRLFSVFFFISNFRPHTSLTTELREEYGLKGTVYKIPGYGDCMLLSLCTLMYLRQEGKSMEDLNYSDFHSVYALVDEQRRALGKETTEEGRFGTWLAPESFGTCARNFNLPIPILENGKFRISYQDGETPQLGEDITNKFRNAMRTCGGFVFLQDGHARCYVASPEDFREANFQSDSDEIVAMIEDDVYGRSEEDDDDDEQGTGTIFPDGPELFTPGDTDGGDGVQFAKDGRPPDGGDSSEGYNFAPHYPDSPWRV